MTVAELTRNLEFLTLSNYEPFIYVGTIKYYSLKTEWGTDVNDIWDTDAKIKAMQVTQDYLNKYDQMDSLEDCEAEEQSFYFDRTNQLVYVHIDHDYSPQTTPVDYGYALGMISSTAGPTYIDDYYYEPCLDDDQSVFSNSADALGTSQPTGSTSTLTIINGARYNAIDKTREGVLDFISSEDIYRNDVKLYIYNDGTLTSLASFFVEDVSKISQSSVELDLQDKRFQ